MESKINYIDQNKARWKFCLGVCLLFFLLGPEKIWIQAQETKTTLVWIVVL